jgi:uncharacterized protein
MEKGKQFLISGGTGFIGNYLCERLMKEGHYLTLITRSPEQYKEENSKNQRFISWDSDLAQEMNRADVVINLVGENLFGKRWTDEVKKRLYNSRIDSTKMLVEAMKKAESPPELLVSASGVNYYGDSGDKLLDEDSEPGNDFLAKLCIDWEAEARKAEEAGVRVAIARLGIVLEEDGGMIEKMKLPFKLFVGGSLGSGKQYLSWIHMTDLCNALIFPVEESELSGPFNACSPNPVTMNEFVSAMGEVMNKPSFFKVPETGLKIALGEASTPILASLKVQPQKLQKLDFTFRYEDLEYALADIL